ncbi:MAG TPA: Crp/Fnr family transcriptional regulator [Gammaproteobacteria bacterium]|nr:Crp/Fnr family transcriptional regulator [Gammaproteobacteria bacterium]
METQAVQPEWLQQYPQLATLNDPAWLAALNKLEIMELPSGSVVFRPGDPCANLLFLIDGRVRVFMHGENGREMAISHLSGGELCVFTLTTLLQGENYSATALTETRACAARLPAADFREAFAHSRGFQDYILAELARRQQHTLLLLQEVAFERLETRLAGFLARQAGNDRHAAVYMTHQQIACELGTTREMISRLLKDMEQRGCVRLRRKRIDVLDAQRPHHTGFGTTMNA